MKITKFPVPLQHMVVIHWGSVLRSLAPRMDGSMLLSYKVIIFWISLHYVAA